MVALARATKDDSFLALDATVLAIVKKRFGSVMKRKFSAASVKAEDCGEAVNVDFLVSFLKDWYSTLNRTYGMGSLMEPKATSSSSSFASSSGQKPTVGAQAGKTVAPSYPTNRTVGKPSPNPSSSSQVSTPRANVAALLLV